MARIRRETGVPIIAAGNTWLDLQQLAQAVRLDCWSAGSTATGRPGRSMW